MQQDDMLLYAGYNRYNALAFLDDAFTIAIVNRTYGDSTFETVETSDNEKGCSGFDLYRTRGGKKVRVASVLFWDVCGQFYLETLNSDVPVEVMEEVIAETKRTIKVR